jgi:DNA-binding NarL/FixJ family response regulator
MSPRTNANSTQARHRILLVDDHAIVREGFTEIINASSNLEVCGEADSAAHAVEAVARLKPDAVMVDLSLHGGSGLDLIKNLKALHPELPMLVLSMHDEGIYAERALRAGALGYVMKREDSATVVEAIQAVLQGHVFLSPTMRGRMLKKVVGGKTHSGQSGIEALTDRELEVLQLLGEGRTTREIAKKLHLSISTVETHRTHIKEKLHLANAAELMFRAVEWARSH